MWAHFWHSFVLPTGMNGMLASGGAKAMVLSSRSVVIVHVNFVSNAIFRSTCHVRRLLVRAAGG